MQDNLHVVDIESKKIEDGAPLLPVPVGCAILYPDGHAHYWAWGHPEGNNCTREEFAAELKRIWGFQMLTHNGCTFDIEDLGHHFQMPRRDPLLTEDTLFAAYLHNPHARSLSLKDLANDWLGIPPDEQQTMYDWIMANVKDCRSRKECGAYISETPVSLSGPYAIGDVVRTKKVWDYVQPLIATMQEPYDRERRLAPILAEIQNVGVRVDLERLKADHHAAMMKLATITQLIREHLKKGPEFNPGSDAELGAALVELGYEGFLTTPTGKLSMSRPSLEAALANDPKLMKMLKTRSILETLTGTFMGPWISYAEANGSRIHAAYNQVRNPEGYGTRTGRLSSSKPNFQNVPKDLGLDYWDEPFPEMRTYLLPDEGHEWTCADFKNQEPRLTAHFEGGALMDAFNEDPLLDPYIFVKDLVGGSTTRHQAKQTFLGLVYALGEAMLAEKLGIPQAVARVIKNTVKAAIPDVVELDKECKKRFRCGLPIRTLGGRLYFCEPASNGRTWEYKALNTLIQGSAADQTKEMMVAAYYEFKLSELGARFLGTVHDEVSVSHPPEVREQVHEILRQAANYLKCDVPMILDIGVGTNWAEAKP